MKQKLHEKLLPRLKRQCNRNDQLWKQRNDAINKGRKENTS